MFLFSNVSNISEHIPSWVSMVYKLVFIDNIQNWTKHEKNITIRKKEKDVFK